MLRTRPHGIADFVNTELRGMLAGGLNGGILSSLEILVLRGAYGASLRQLPFLPYLALRSHRRDQQVAEINPTGTKPLLLGYPRFPQSFDDARLLLTHHVGGEDRGEAAGPGHCSGTPALRRPSKMGSSWARYVGSSLIAVQAARAREMAKVGLACVFSVPAHRARLAASAITRP